MNLKTIFSFAIGLFLFLPYLGSAQTFDLSGKVFEKENLQPIIGASIAVKKDGKILAGSASDEKGFFQVKRLPADTYQISFSYVGLKTKTQQVIVGSDRYMGAVVLEKNTNALEELKIEATQIRVEQKGDTTSINAAAYKVNQDATAEDLVKKMPGITIENGTVKAQGEDVKKILVDGKEFFGDDANMALKNLPAEIIDKVQIFNRASDQAQFTGFNDGNTDKTMNITTKSGRNNGTFGKLYAGYGTNDRYQAGGNMNFFKGDRRITVLGLSNNVNQQNFSMQDLFGGSGSAGRMPMGGRGGPRGGGGMGGPMSDFMVGQQNGVSTTQSIGLNYSDKWGIKTNVSGSYFFNNSSTITNQLSNRTYLIDQETKQFYVDSTGSETNNYNNRFNLRLEHTFDSSHAIIYTPKFSFQSNENTSNQLALNTVNDTLLNSNSTYKKPINTGFNVNNNVLYRYKFEKPGRTISLNLIHDLNRRNNDTKQISDITALVKTGSYVNTLLRQQSLSNSNSNNYNANLTYTENLTDSTQLQLSYNPILNHNLAERATNRFDTANGAYSRIDTLLSNNFDNTITTHRANVSININKNKWKFSAGVTQQFLTIASLQTFPENRTFEKSFQNLLPNLNFTYNFSNANTFRFFYRTNTNNPGVTQLQNVIDNTNPVMLSAGNPNLRQEFSQTLLSRYGSNNWHNSQSFFVFAMVTFTDDYIANSTFTATRDSVLDNGMLLSRGSQIARPVNLNGNVNARSFITYGIPVKALKSNVNMNLGVNYSKVPGLVNQLQNFANTFNINTGIVIGSNISEQVDFTISHTSNINFVENTVLSAQNSNFFINTSNVKLNVMPTSSWVIQSDINYTNFSGLGSDFNQNFFLWNAGIAYKFMKRMAEVKLSVFDLLNQNNNINRTVTETYIEDTRSNVLNRYYMLTFTYNIRKFKASPKS
ncbi:MAG: outer membrane beta-barrel protein [Sphingobacteriales bacterium]|nr:outer membrane beta-barrel protein [Sphingobacteriales bacterium]